jgi:type II secretory pathway component PulF
MLAVLVSALGLWLLIMMASVIGASGGLLSVFGVIVVVTAAAIGASVIFAKWRVTNQDALLWALAIASDRGMPLMPTFEAFAPQAGFRLRRRIEVLLHWLRQGTPLAEALGILRGVLPRDAEVLVRVGAEFDILPRAFHEAVEARKAQVPGWALTVGRFVYLTWVMLVMQAIFGFMTYFIMPKYEAIFRDFGISLPRVTVALIQISHFFAGFWWLALLIVLAEAVVLLLASLSMFGWMSWNIPLFNRIFLRRHTAIVLRALALAVENDKPIGQAIDALVRHYPSDWIRSRLLGVARDVQHGADWSQALRYHGLINKADLAVLESAQRVGNLPWALRQTAESGERRLAYRLQIITQGVFPLFVLAIGAMAFFIIFGYFSPLVSLIEVLAG